MATHTINGAPCDVAGKYSVEHESNVFSGIGEVSYSDFRMPGRHGVIPTLDGTTGPGGYALVWHCTAATAEATDALRDELLALVGPRNSLVTIQRTVNGVTREARAQVLSVSEGEQEGNWMRLRAAFTIPGVFWRDPSPKTAPVAVGTSTPAALTGGSAPMTDPVLTVTGAGANTSIRLTDVDSGAWVALVGNVTSGQSVTIDTAAMTARAGATVYDALLDFGPIPFRVSPSARLTATGGAVSVSVRRAWW